MGVRGILPWHPLIDRNDKKNLRACDATSQGLKQLIQSGSL